MKPNIQTFGTMCLLLLAVSHTSMVIFDSLAQTALGSYVWAKTIIAVFAAAAMEGAVVIYLHKGLQRPAGINAAFTVVVYLCCVKPITALPGAYYLGIAEIVFGFSLGYNMWVYGKIAATENANEAEKAAVLEAHQQQITAFEQSETALKQQIALLEQSETALKQQIAVFEQDSIALKQQIAVFEQSETALKQQVDELKAFKKASTCECGYVAELKHHKVKCSHHNLQQ